MDNKMVRRGEIWLVNFTEVDQLTSNKQTGRRPAIVIQNNIGNSYSPTVLVIPLSSNIRKAKLPTHVVFKQSDGVCKPSFSMAEQIQTIDKTQLVRKLAVATESTMNRVDSSILISLGLESPVSKIQTA